LAEGDRADRAVAGPISVEMKGKQSGPQGELGRNQDRRHLGCRKPFHILNQGFGFKTKGFKYFETKFELRSN
jgi:hypothetical protein